jgi:hypothetical protein
MEERNIIMLEDYDKFFNSAYMKKKNIKVNFHHFYGDTKTEIDFILNSFPGYFKKSLSSNNMISITDKMPYPHPLFLIPGNFIVFSTLKDKKSINDLYILTYRGFVKRFKVNDIKDIISNKINYTIF